MQVVFFLWDLLSASVYTFTVYFLVTFVVLRRELQRIGSRDNRSRREMLMFTFRKGLVFGLMLLAFKLLLMLCTGRLVHEASSESSAIGAVYSLAREVLFLSVLFKGLLRRRHAIKTDCDVVKEEAKIYLMLSFLYKKGIGRPTVVRFFRSELAQSKELQFNKTRLKGELRRCREAKLRELEKTLEINDVQNFRNVLLKSHKSSVYPKRAILIMSVIFAAILISDCLSLGSFMLIPQNQVSCNYYGTFIVLKWITKFLEFYYLPYLLTKTVQKRVFFGEEEAKDQDEVRV